MNEELEEINEEEFEDKLHYKIERKVVGWGAMKEYPAIVSVLVSIAIPLIGLSFVANQVEYRKLKYGHASGFLLGLSATISLLWWAAVIIALFIIF